MGGTLMEGAASTQVFRSHGMMAQQQQQQPTSARAGMAAAVEVRREGGREGREK